MALLVLVGLLGRGLVEWYDYTRDEWRPRSWRQQPTPTTPWSYTRYLDYRVEYHYNGSSGPRALGQRIYNADDPSLRQHRTGRDRAWLIIFDPSSADVGAARAPGIPGRTLVDTRRLSALKVERYERTG